LLVPKADYFGEQISTKKLLSIIKKELIQYEFEGIFEEIKNYINVEERDLKLNELGI
jgi:hypothetical protein